MDSENDDFTDYYYLAPIIEVSNSEERVIHRNGERLVEDSSPLHLQVTIGILPDDILIKIFKSFIDEIESHFYPSEEWHTLVHVCRRWRNVVFSSPRHLNLVLLCQSPYRSAEEMLDIWPELPIYIHDFGHSSNEARDDLVAALRLNHRVSGIRLNFTSASGWETFAPVMQQSFPALTHLWLEPFFQKPGISHSFLGGSAPSLRDLVLVGIPFPPLVELLLSATNLVRLRYDSIPRSGYISPQEMVTGLSALTRLESLSLKFLLGDLPDRANRIPPPHTRTLFPALTDLCFSGAPEYISDLVAQIDAPSLEWVRITVLVFDWEVLELLELAKFVRRADKLSLISLPHRADVIVWFDGISIALSPELQLGLYDPKTLILDFACLMSALRLSYLVQFYASCLPTSSPVESLHIRGSMSYPPWQHFIDDPNPQWLELLRPFNAVKDLRLSYDAAAHVAQALRGLRVEQVTAVLPALKNVFISGLEPSGPVREAIFKFADKRRHSGHPVYIQDWM